MPTRFRRLYAFLLLLALLPLAGAGAQEPQTDTLTSAQAKVIAQLAKRADALESAVGANRENDAQLTDIRLQLDEIGRALIDSGVAFRPRLAAINDRLGQLGASPGEGQPPEPEAVAAERKALVSEKAGINAVIGTAEQLSIRVDTLQDRITNLRRSLFTSLFTRRTPIDFALAGEVAASFREEVSDLGRSVAAWLNFVIRFKLQSVLVAGFLALLAATVFTVGGRQLIGGLLKPDPAVANPPPLSRLAVAYWATILPTVALSVFLGLAWLLFDSFGVLRGDIGAMLFSLFQVVTIVFFVHRLAALALNPRLPQWRLIPVESRPALLLLVLVSATVLLTALDNFLASIFVLRGSPLSLTVGASFVSTVAVGLLIVLIGLVKPFADAQGNPRPWPAPVRFALFGLGGLAIAAALLGYLGLARFVARQVVVTGAILTAMGIGFLLARAVAAEGAFAPTRPGRFLRRRFGFEDAALDQTALAASIAINLVVLAVGLPSLILQWGFQTGDLRAWAYQVGSGITIGTLHFAPLGILTGIAVFLLGFFVTRWFQRWLDRSVLARGRVDSGVRNSIRLVVGYAGVALAGLIAVSAAGIDLSSLALVAGALSLGIGFGLQNIVNNFVSGLILLAERPFKVGDWIVAGAVTGTVRKISVRATEVETFQRQTVILPNSDLINGAVGNWTHRNRLGRVDIKVNAAYGTDIRRAVDVLLDLAKAHPQVLRNPEPTALFLNFGPAVIELELRVFLADIFAQNTVGNDLRFAIMDAFAREGIEMPATPRPEPKPAETHPVDALAPKPKRLLRRRRRRKAAEALIP